MNRQEDVVTRLVAARDPSAAAVLVRLSQDWDPAVRAAVAENPGAPRATLGALSRDTDRWVRQRVAENPHTLPETRDVLSRDTDPDVRQAATRDRDRRPMKAEAGEKAKPKTRRVEARMDPDYNSGHSHDG